MPIASRGDSRVSDVLVRLRIWFNQRFVQSPARDHQAPAQVRCEKLLLVDRLSHPSIRTLPGATPLPLPNMPAGPSSGTTSCCGVPVSLHADQSIWLSLLPCSVVASGHDVLLRRHMVGNSRERLLTRYQNPGQAPPTCAKTLGGIEPPDGQSLQCSRAPNVWRIAPIRRQTSPPAVAFCMAAALPNSPDRRCSPSPM